MRDSAKRHQFEQYFKELAGTPQMNSFVEYLELKKDMLLKILLASNGEEAIVLRGELNGIIKLLTVLSPFKSH